jgi:hypothetical protein
MSASNKRLNKKDKLGRNHGGGYPKFRPSEAQRQAVRIMSGVKMSVDEIRKVILNPLTGLPLTKAAMYRHFRREIDEGPQSLKALIAEKYMAHLKEGREYAVRLGLKNKMAWSTEGSAPPPAFALDVAQDAEPLRVTFVMPTLKAEDQPPIVDVTPSGPIDPAQKRLPPPRERDIQTPFGRWKSEPGDWMK